MFTRRILALAAALLTTLAITGTAADTATAASPPSPHFTVRAASLAATSTGPTRHLPDLQIAERLFINVRTVCSHLGRIRDKTECRRRADLTRLALQADLVWPAANPERAALADCG